MSATADGAPGGAELTAEQAAATMRSKQYVGLLMVAAIIGVIVSLAAWCFLELQYQLQRELFTHLPDALGYENGPPVWWPLPILTVGALLVALAITRLPGDGGHLPARGLAPGGSTSPATLPGVLLAALATLGFGLVLGPEAPLIALGSGLATLSIRAARKEAPSQVQVVMGATGAFAALSLIFGSPLIAAIILIEATGLGGARLPLVLIPGLLGAGIGSLVSIGMGSFTGLSRSAYALAPISMPHFTRPDIAEFGWTILLAIVVAILTRAIMVGGLRTHGLVTHRMLVLLPLVGLVIAGLAIGFHQASGKSVNEVLFSGETALPGLIAQAGTWSLSALALLIVFKGIAYGLSLGSFRGGPTFPAIFLGAAGGIMASRLPGFAFSPAVAVGIGAAVVAVLRLPLSAVALATLLTYKAGTGDEPLIILGVVVSYLVTLAISAVTSDEAKSPAPDASAPQRSADVRSGAAGPSSAPTGG